MKARPKVGQAIDLETVHLSFTNCTFTNRFITIPCAIRLALSYGGTT